jgi:hypothetical protein
VESPEAVLNIRLSPWAAPAIDDIAPQAKQHASVQRWLFAKSELFHKVRSKFPMELLLRNLWRRLS